MSDTSISAISDTSISAISDTSTLARSDTSTSAMSDTGAEKEELEVISYSPELQRVVYHVFLQHYTNAPSAPNLTTAEVIACVLVHKARPLNINTIALEAMCRFPTFACSIASAANCIENYSVAFGHEIMKAVRCYDFGFTRHAPVGVDVQFSLSNSAATYILREHLGLCTAEIPDPEGECFFLDKLPTELRNNVYELVLRFPDSGIMIHRNPLFQPRPWGNRRVHIKSLAVLTRDSALHMDVNAWDDIIQPIRTPYQPGASHLDVPLPKLLSLLAVNHQVRGECASIFYHGNRFCAPDLITLYQTTLDDRVPTLWQYGSLRKVGFSLRPSMSFGASGWHIGFGAFKSYPFGAFYGMGVESIAVYIAQKDWKVVEWEERRPEDVWPPGVKALANVPDLKEILVQGEWREFAVYLRRIGSVPKVMFNGEVVEIERVEEVEGVDDEAESEGQELEEGDWSEEGEGWSEEGGVE